MWRWLIVCGSVVKEAAMCQAEDGKSRSSLVEVGDGAYAYIQDDGSWWVNNTGLLVGNGTAFSIDTCATEARTAAYREAIATVTSEPVRAVVNTHHHGDHTFGNYQFGTAAIVAHEATRAGIAAWGKPFSEPYWTDVDWGDISLAPPMITYQAGIDLWVDDRRAEVRHTGVPGHTNNDSYVWLDDLKLLYAGDLLFNGGTPFLLQGSVTGCIEVLETQLKPLGAAVVVPGHGGVCGPEVIDTVLGYMRFILDAARRAVAGGTSALEAARSLDLGDYAGWHDPERVVGNLHRAMAELSGAATGCVLPYREILAEMVEFNGGRLVSRA
jgi:cyclase